MNSRIIIYSPLQVFSVIIFVLTEPPLSILTRSAFNSFATKDHVYLLLIIFQKSLNGEGIMAHGPMSH